jgi:hypothetical protein
MKHYFPRIPRLPLALMLITSLPFFYGAAMALGLPAWDLLADTVPNWSHGPDLMTDYGRLLLALMSGVYLAFATLARARLAPVAYLPALAPALWGYVRTTDLTSLLYGLLALLLLDAFYWQLKLSPRWWLGARCLITALSALSILAALA